jgi:Zn-dependent peptidase ImmA (M78 family)
MKLTRMDLDGTGSPMGLVSKILKAEPGLVLPIPIEELAARLDITEIRDMTSDKFEGGLITDTTRSSGFILVNRTAITGRRRFTIGHELGHFLMTAHKPPPGGFQCTRSDMRRWDNKDTSPTIKMEVEANEFAGLMLMPPPLWRRETARFNDPDLSQVIDLAKIFDVSKEAAARSYAVYHEQLVAVAVTKENRINKIYRNVTRFPTMCVKQGDPVPPSSILFRASAQAERPTELTEARSELWLESEWGKRLPALYEQAFFQKGGFALLMLWAEVEEEEEKDDDRTSKQRFRDQQQRWTR